MLCESCRFQRRSRQLLPRRSSTRPLRRRRAASRSLRLSSLLLLRRNDHGLVALGAFLGLVLVARDMRLSMPHVFHLRAMLMALRACHRHSGAGAGGDDAGQPAVALLAAHRRMHALRDWEALVVFVEARRRP